MVLFFLNLSALLVIAGIGNRLPCVETEQVICSKPFSFCDFNFFQNYGHRFRKHMKPTNILCKNKLSFDQKLAVCIAVWEEYHIRKLGKFKYRPSQVTNEEKSCKDVKVQLSGTKASEVKAKVFECPMRKMTFDKISRHYHLDNFYIAKGPKMEPNSVFHLVEIARTKKPALLESFYDAADRLSSSSKSSQLYESSQEDTSRSKRPTIYLKIVSWHYGSNIPLPIF